MPDVLLDPPDGFLVQDELYEVRGQAFRDQVAAVQLGEGAACCTCRRVLKKKEKNY